MPNKLYALVFLLIAADCAANAPALALPPAKPITQWRINEFAAYCLEARIALKGLKAEPLPGEPATSYRRRISRYFAALDLACHRLAPLRSAPRLQDRSSLNILLWSRIRAHSIRLPVDVAAARATWHNGRPLGSPSVLGSKLLTALDTLMALLNDLRNARP
ncbi:MAG: hypothetical protein ACP5VE_06295 [Chthonomonadales bacterium]